MSKAETTDSNMWRGYQYKKISIKQNLNLSGLNIKENDYEIIETLHRKLSKTSNKLKLVPCEIAP